MEYSFYFTYTDYQNQSIESCYAKDFKSNGSFNEFNIKSIFCIYDRLLEETSDNFLE